MYTGMEVLFPDRARFHGVGIVPDIEVAPTAADIAEGRDPELLRAIHFLQTGQ
jgi:C-terminal processing protease CtpA/Prc